MSEDDYNDCVSWFCTILVFRIRFLMDPLEDFSADRVLVYGPIIRLPVLGASQDNSTVEFNVILPWVLLEVFLRSPGPKIPEKCRRDFFLEEFDQSEKVTDKCRMTLRLYNK